MEQFIKQAIRFVNQFGESAHSFNRETWIVISVCTVVTGYFLLRGNPNRC